ncbi:MAG TPA: aminoglycoside phosphotransferase family protein [Umezawaea sp.]|nr:aminoglycoside phosphotransferase family protein [Umezawaea sp.]
MRGTAGREDLAEVVRAGCGRELVSVRRLTGGTSKGVYRLALEDGSTVVVYLWDPAENYWAEPVSGVEAFLRARDRFAAAGVRTPRVLVVDRSRALHRAEYALVEDVRGQRLSDIAAPSPRTLRLLGAALRRMAACSGPGPDVPCEVAALSRALADLGQAAARVDRIGAVRERLEAVVRELAAAVRPRTRHGLVHGELGPEHVLVDDDGEPVVIDIEGASFTDVEWEHAFLSFRYGPGYRWLEVPGLDPARVRFYRLALHLSLVAGPLRLLDGDFPDRAGMMLIVEENVERALGYG